MQRHCCSEHASRNRQKVSVVIFFVMALHIFDTTNFTETSITPEPLGVGRSSFDTICRIAVAIFLLFISRGCGRGDRFQIQRKNVPDYATSTVPRGADQYTPGVNRAYVILRVV